MINLNFLYSDPKDILRLRSVGVGFNGFAFLFGKFWLLWCGLWLPFLFFFSIDLISLFLLSDPTAQFFCSLVCRFFMGFAGNSLLEDKMKRQGYILRYLFFIERDIPLLVKADQ